jgi:hypothetical protein
MRFNRGSKAALPTLALAAVALAVPALSLGGQTQPPVRVAAELKGQNEVPGPGDPNGRGEVLVKLKREKRKVCFELAFRRLNGASAAHIHKGAEDVAGGIKVELFAEDLPGEDRVEDCVRNVSRKLIRKIGRRPENFYVNVHNEEYPDGAIRGQLAPVEAP